MNKKIIMNKKKDPDDRIEELINRTKAYQHKSSSNFFIACCLKNKGFHKSNLYILTSTPGGTKVSEQTLN